MSIVETKSTGGRHIVITVHGINTFGQWQERLVRLLNKDHRNIEVINYNYGVYGLIRFLAPPLRWQAGHRFQRWLLNQNLDLSDVDRVDFVAHSFGTHLLGATIARLTKARSPILNKVNTIIVAGSVLESDFACWDRLLKEYPGVRVVNECGWKDRVLIASQLFCIGTGMAGKIGFKGGISRRFRNRFHSFGHCGFFEDSAGRIQDEFMRDHWIPLLTIPSDQHQTPDGPDERPTLFWYRSLWIPVLNAATIPKLVCYLLMIAIVPVSWFFWEEKAARNELERTQRSLERDLVLAGVKSQNAQLLADNQIKKLTHDLDEATLKADRKLFSAEEMMDVAKLSPLLETSVVHNRARRLLLNASAGSMMPELDNQATIFDSLSLVNPDLNFPSEFSEEVIRLRDLVRNSSESQKHGLTRGLAEHWLMVNQGLNTSKMADAHPDPRTYEQKIKDIDFAFQDALKWSESENNDSERMFVNYTYGIVLLERHDYKNAADYLRKAIEFIPKDDPAKLNIAAHWFHIHALASLADAESYKDWEIAVDDLKKALEIAEDAKMNDSPTSVIQGQLHLKRGWVYLSRFKVAEADAEFSIACKKLEPLWLANPQATVANPQAMVANPQAIDDFFWARHGKAMTEYHLLAKTADGHIETYRTYSKLVTDIKNFFNDEVRLTIRDRINLHNRWLNSQERMGDSQILMANLCDFEDQAAFTRAGEAYEEIVPYYSKYSFLLANPERVGAMAAVKCKEAVTAAVLRNNAQASKFLAEAQSFSGQLPLGSSVRTSADYYRHLAEISIKICNIAKAPDAAEITREVETSLSEILDRFMNSRPERQDLEFLYLVIQLQDSKTRDWNPNARPGTAGPLMKRIRDLMNA